MYHTLLLPTLLYLVTLLVALPVRVLFILVFLQSSSHDCSTTSQFVNADASNILRRGSRRPLGFNSKNSVNTRAVPTVQTTGLPGSWQYSRCLA
jgi:hypothetical protein